LNHRLGALLLALLLALPVAAATVHADASSTLVYVSNSVYLDLFGNVEISTGVTLVNNGTTDTGPLNLSLTYGGNLTPFVVNQTSNFNVTNTVVGSSTTTFDFNVSSVAAGNSSQLNFDLKLNGTVQYTGPGTRFYNLTTFPVVGLPGATLANATSYLTLPLGANATTNLTQYNYTLQFASPPSYNLVFTNGTLPVSSFVPVDYTQPDVVFRVDNSVTVDQFGWTYINTVVTVNNTGTTATGTLPVNMTYDNLLPPYTWNESSSSSSVNTTATNSTTSYELSLPSVGPGAGAQASLSLKTWGVINEYSQGAYTYNFTTFPDVDIPGAGIYNATSTISLPSGTSLSTDLTGYGFVAQPPANPVYTQYFTDYAAPTPESIAVNFSVTSSTDLGLFQIDSVDRTVGITGSGSILVTDTVTITNFDTQDITSLNLTYPATGQFALKEGWVDGGTITLSNGIINLPVPISATSLQTFVLQYTLPRAAVVDNGGTLSIDLGVWALNYTNLVQSYTVSFSFPSGTVAQASTPTSFVNSTVMPDVLLTARVPFGWNLYLVTPALIGMIIAAVFIFFLFRRTNLEPYEQEGIAIVKAKSDVVSSLLEQYRLRGEGFSPFEDYSAHRKALEEEKAKLTSRLQDFKAKALRDKAQRPVYDRTAAEDARLEQIYREGRASLEERIAGRLAPKDFESKIMKLKESAQPRSPLKEKKQAA